MGREPDYTNPFMEGDRDIELTERGDLPHMHQDGKIQFVTFRLNDSLPYELRSHIDGMRLDFMRDHPEPWDAATNREWMKICTPMIERYADQGAGACHLRDPNVREILRNVIMYFDGVRYDIKAYVIMPNHVHMLLHVYPGFRLPDIMRSIKQRSAMEINRHLGLSGRLWQSESYDTLVRNLSHYENCLRYIRLNPNHLKNDDYELYDNAPL